MSESDSRLRIAVLVSGSGTNLQALIDRARDGRLAAEIVVVASDRPGIRGLARAEAAGIPARVVDYRGFLKQDWTVLGRKLPVDVDAVDRVQNILHHEDREERLKRLVRLMSAEAEMIAAIEAYRPDYVCLAGFMRLVTPFFLHHFNEAGKLRVVNIHPALLPAFPGQHGYEDTFSYGCRWGGITIHFVDEGEDSGPIIAQAVYPILPEDDIEKVRQRGLQLEYEMYAQVINWLAAGRVELVPAAGGRARTVIRDPEYPRIMASWVRKALDAGPQDYRSSDPSA